VSGVTSSGRLSTRETVIGDTPATLATSVSVTLPDDRLELGALSERSDEVAPLVVWRRAGGDGERDTAEPIQMSEYQFTIALTLSAIQNKFQWGKIQAST
jgi:hypothetical protein